MKNSAAAMALLPALASLTDAVTVGATLAGLGLTVTLDVVGPVESGSPAAKVLMVEKPAPVILWLSVSTVAVAGELQVLPFSLRRMKLDSVAAPSMSLAAYWNL